jgi:hypothetical protein
MRESTSADVDRADLRDDLILLDLDRVTEVLAARDSAAGEQHVGNADLGGFRATLIANEIHNKVLQHVLASVFLDLDAIDSTTKSRTARHDTNVKRAAPRGSQDSQNRASFSGINV